MDNFKVNFKNVIFALIIALGLILLILAVSSKVASQGVHDLKIDYTITDKAEKQTVFDALKDFAASKNYDLKYNNNYSYGVFVESIGGVKNGDNGKYWQYYVNDKLGEVAADKKEVKAGDKVEWRFEKVPES